MYIYIYIYTYVSHSWDAMGSMDHTPFQDPNKVELTELHRSTASEQNLFGGLEHNDDTSDDHYWIEWIDAKFWVLLQELVIIIKQWTHEFYDFPFSWECHHPNDELHDCSEG